MNKASRKGADVRSSLPAPLREIYLSNRCDSASSAIPTATLSSRGRPCECSKAWKSTPCCTAATSARWRSLSCLPPGRRISSLATAMRTRALRRRDPRAGQTCHGLFGDLEFDGVRVALLHSHERKRFREAIDSGEYGLVCYGHTHVAAIDRHGETLVLNPGAIYRATRTVLRWSICRRRGDDCRGCDPELQSRGLQSHEEMQSQRFLALDSATLTLDFLTPPCDRCDSSAGSARASSGWQQNCIR